MSHHEYILGTRGSALALTQSRIAAETVTSLYTEHQAHHGAADAEVVDFTLRTVKTEGDVLTGPLATLGGTGVFAAALRQRLLDGENASEEKPSGHGSTLPQGPALRALPRSGHRRNPQA